MSLETYTGYIKDMVDTNPSGGDPKSQGDDHLRGIKYTLQVQFSGLTTATPVTVTAEQINVAGMTVPDKVNRAGDTMTGQLAGTSFAASVGYRLDSDTGIFSGGDGVLNIVANGMTVLATSPSTGDVFTASRWVFNALRTTESVPLASNESVVAGTGWVRRREWLMGGNLGGPDRPWTGVDQHAFGMYVVRIDGCMLPCMYWPGQLSRSASGFVGDRVVFYTLDDSGFHGYTVLASGTDQQRTNVAEVFWG